MSTTLHLATKDDTAKLLPLVAAFHEAKGWDVDDAHREKAVLPLLNGSPYGAVYLIGPRMAPIGYAVVTFGWSIELGGMDAFIDEVYLRPSVRGRGIGTEVLQTLSMNLSKHRVRAIHLEVETGNDAAKTLYEKAEFVAQTRYELMTRKLG